MTGSFGEEDFLLGSKGFPNLSLDDGIELTC